MPRPTATAASALLALVAVAALAACARAGIVQPTNITQIIQGWGYPVEEHTVLTADGYFLSTQRIPNPGKPAVYLQHGVLDSANGWAMNPPSEVLSAFLWDKGYDVWLGNSRGNGYSMSAQHFDSSDSEYWNFTVDQMGKFDVPATIDYILEQTGHQQLSYVGHSQGTTIAFIAFEDPAVAAKVKLFVALAPVVHVQHVQSQLLKWLAQYDPFPDLLKLGIYEFLPDKSLIDQILPGFCQLFTALCEYPACLFAGCDIKDLNQSRIPFYFAHYPMPTSTKDVIQWAQWVNSGSFAMFDYGSAADNEAHYGQPTPPMYSLPSVSVPTAIFYGGQDVLADPSDVQYILNTLPHIVYTKYLPTYGHIDFVWGDQAINTIYSPIVTLLQGGAPF